MELPNYTISSVTELTAATLAAELNKSQRTVERHLAKLVEARLLSREGFDKTGHWVVL